MSTPKQVSNEAPKWPICSSELSTNGGYVIIYITNAIESVHMRLRKIIKTRGHFPTDEAATKLIWLALCKITADWTRPTRQWKAAMNQFAIMYADRFKPSAA